MSKLPKHQAGISLIEVLIAVVILSFGMLALASLQAKLFQAGAEAKARATATAVAQGEIERLRAFSSLTGATDSYASIATGTFNVASDSGVQYFGCRQVRRFRFNKTNFSGPGALPLFDVNSATQAVTCGDAGDPNSASAVSATIPEFKEVTTNVGWIDSNGDVKKMQLTDTIAAISPDDSLQLAKSLPEPTKGPTMYWNANFFKNTPGVVPQNIGASGLSGASTNPAPMQFVDDVSSVTTFDTLIFSSVPGNADAVKVQRNISTTAVSCVCSAEGDPKSSDTNPAYEPAVWNGKVLSYLPPSQAPTGKSIGNPIVSNSDSAIRSVCTVCCRDHHDSATKQPGVNKNLRVDPYRPLNTDGSHDHYGFKKQGQGYVLDTLLPVGSQTNNEYVEACRLVRVDGVMRLAVDADQNSMVIAPLSADQTTFQQSDFIDRYSKYVNAYAQEAVSAVSATGSTYPTAPTTLPAASDTIKTNYKDILEPAALNYADSSANRKLISVGLYIDYLSPETLEAFNCAVKKDNTSSKCAGLGARDPMEYIPYYALNVASLGTWASENPSVVQIDGATYNNQGRLATQGGLANWGNGSSSTTINGSEEINISNSGLTATVPVDTDDEASTSFTTDLMGFLKLAGTTPPTPTKLVVKVAASSTITLSKIGVFSPISVPCNYNSNAKSDTCIVDSSSSTITVRFANYTTQQGQTITNRKICLPSDARIAAGTPQNNGTINEYLDVQFTGVNTVDHLMTIEIVGESTACGQNMTSLTP